MREGRKNPKEQLNTINYGNENKTREAKPWMFLDFTLGPSLAVEVRS